MEAERKASRGNVDRYDLEILLRRPSLRASMARRVSQVRPGSVYTQETICGYGCIKGRWLQSFANRSSYIFIFGIIGSFYGSYYAYFYSVITTLEKKFKISSQTIGIIASSGDIVGVILCFLLSLCVPKHHRPRFVGIGVLLIFTSTIIFTLPHYLQESKNVLDISRNETEFKDCTESKQICTESPIYTNGTVILLILAQILHGFGGSLYYIFGKSYENDNIDKEQPFALQSFVSVLKILGPAFGYWLSSVCLKIYENPRILPNNSEDDPHWIGAWWLGSMVIGFVLIVPGLLVTLFPSTLPKAAVRRIHSPLKSSIRIEQDVLHKKRKATTLKRLFINPTFGCTHFGAIFNIVGFMAYFIFLPKYAETQYRVSPSNANFVSGSITLISSAVGTVAANSVITRYRPSARILASWIVVVGFLSLGGLTSYIYLGCQENDDDIKALMDQHFNSTCKCVNFLPICDENSQSFISPCHSACDILYFNNTQGLGSCFDRKTSKVKNISKGFCTVDCQFDFIKFTLLTCMVAFVFATGRTSQYWFKAKFEEDEGKSILSSKMTFLGLLATIPAPIVFGYIFDKSCLLWEGNCEGSGNCWLYDNEKLRLHVNLIAVGFAFIGIIFDLGVWYSVKNLELFDDINYYCGEDE